MVGVFIFASASCLLKRLFLTFHYVFFIIKFLTLYISKHKTNSILDNFSDEESKQVELIQNLLALLLIIKSQSKT